MMVLGAHVFILLLSSPLLTVEVSARNLDDQQQQQQQQYHQREEQQYHPQEQQEEQREQQQREQEAEEHTGNITLFNHPACAADIEAALVSRRCEPIESFRKNDFALIACLTNLAPVQQQEDGAGGDGKAEGGGSGLSEKCEHVLWDYKVRLTNEEAILKDVSQACPEDMRQFQECLMPPKKPLGDTSVTDKGRIISCIIELKNEPTRRLVESCGQRITQIEAVVFSDYRLIGGFVERCHADIQKMECGRLVDKTAFHSQGKVIECLTEQMRNLSQPCRNQIFQVAEFQGDDYHLDRSLFLACKRDRHNLCASEKAGQGRVFDCLMKNKMAPEMSKRCRLQLLRRQKLIAEDYKVSRGLAVACREEIEMNKCATRLEKDDHMTVKLAQVLLCLEHTIRNGGEIGGTCRVEMKEHRRMLMEDFRMSPEIVDACNIDIQASCGSFQAGGETIHCLMQVASQHHLRSEKCEAILKSLLRQADVGSDWKVDPILQKNCQDIVMSSCDPKSGGEAILSCLMTLSAQNSRQMTKECQTTLLEIQYFLARDFSLNPELYRKCHKDAERLCHAEDDWHVRKDQGEHKLVFPCLVRYLYVDEEEDPQGRKIDDLTEDCADEVENVLEQRAISVNLHPEIEEVCRGYLVNNCGDRHEVGAELACLQENMVRLDDDCRKAVESYSMIESRNIMLNSVVAASCTEIIQKHCKDGLQKKDEGRVMHCLIQLKTEDEAKVNEKCSTAVEHWQIFTLTDWKLSPSFKKSCHIDIKNICVQPVPQSKLEVLSCLSETIQRDMLEDLPPKVSPQCRAELKFELLQKHSDIKLDPELERLCSKELEKFCVKDRTLECLKQQDHRRMNDRCRELVFAQEKEQALMNEVDPVLMRKCGSEIQRHCKGQTSPNGVLECLEENKDDANFDPKCKQVVIRRIVQEMSDYRLNPRLQKNCAPDLIKFCAPVIYKNSEKNIEKDFLEGKVIQCLKDKFIEDDARLTKTCRVEIENVLRNAAVDIRANPMLLNACPKTIEFCRTTTDSKAEVMGDGGKIEECLIDLYRNKTLGHFGDQPDCIEHVAKLIQAEAMDIKVDHVLHEACSLDLSKFCRDIDPGSGQQLTCLRNVKEDHGLQLEPKCEKMLIRRVDIYNMALREFPLRGVQDAYNAMAKSPHKNYFLLVGLSLLGAIFMMGLMCGRVTKRVRRELKNK